MIQKIRMRIRLCRMSKNGKAMMGWLVYGLGRRVELAKAEVVEVFGSFCLRWGRIYLVVPVGVYSRKADHLSLFSWLGISCLVARMVVYAEMRAKVVAV